MLTPREALTVIGAMLAGGDSIDDCDLRRSAALPEVFDQVRVPSTIGTWLRSFRWHHVCQLDAASRELLARQWAAGAGPTDLSGSLTIDVDSTVVEVLRPRQAGRSVRLHDLLIVGHPTLRPRIRLWHVAAADHRIALRDTPDRRESREGDHAYLVHHPSPPRSRR